MAFKKVLLQQLIAGICAGMAGATGAADAANVGAQVMPEVTVSGTREKELLTETPASVGIIKADAIRQAGPAHPQQILGQIPGVAVAVTNGEGHTTAIRQPFTTNPVYLYLEDGIPIRATGFFNHNALYEVNIPMAGGIEVTRGPGTALYGSDAIGGVVNILTKAPSAKPELSLTGEAGSYGWGRILGSASTNLSQRDGLRADVNLTHTDGWRDKTSYDRQSANFRWDRDLDADTTLKTILGLSKIDQQTGANTPLTYSDYLNNPTRNNLSIAYRKVEAARLSSNYEKQLGNNLLSITPYFRDNSMELNGSYNLSSDPRIETGKNQSYGVMAKWRQDFPEMMRARLIVGLDVDYSPGSRAEDNLLVTKSGSGANTVYSAYTIGKRIYDYDVTFKSTSPYIHGEISPAEKLRLTAGLRYDSLGYDMSNNLAAGAVSASVLGSTKYYGQITNNSVDYDHTSPKLGATYEINPAMHVYTSYNHSFRAPSESQLYRAGNAANTTDALNKARLATELKPIKANQFEIGLRGDVSGWNYNVVAYDLIKKDDLVSQKDLATNISTSVNAGKTEHKGVELGLGNAFTSQWRLDLSLSYARHTYVDWVTATADYSGKEMESAPRVLGNTRLTWAPAAGTTAQLEWVHIGSYWLEASNSATYDKYPGHNLVNLRASYAVTKDVSLFGRIINLSDKRFADSASVSSSTAVYSPGLPRAYYAGLEAKF